MNKDTFDKLLAALSRNRYTAVASCAVLCLILTSCAGGLVKKPHAPALSADWRTGPTAVVVPKGRVSATDYERELLLTMSTISDETQSVSNQLARLNAAVRTISSIVEKDDKVYEASVAQLDSLFQGISAIITSGASAVAGPAGASAASTILGLGGLMFGAARHVDARRKDRVIAELKSKTVGTPQSNTTT